MTTLDILDIPSAALPVPLTLSGNEQTPATRAAGTQGDGLTGVYAGSSIGAWEATTNLVTNGGFETNATGWTDGINFTIARSTANKHFGVACGRSTCDNTGTGTLGTHNFTAAGASAHYASMWVYVPSTWTGATLSVIVANLTSATGTLTGSVNMNIRDQWQRVTAGPFTPDAGDLTGAVTLATAVGNANQGEYIDIDDVQVENQPLATPYVHTDGGTAARTKARIQIANPLRYFNATQGWAAFLFRMGWGNAAETGAGFPAFLSYYVDANNRLELYYRESTNSFATERRITSTSATEEVAQTLAAGDIAMYIGAWTPAVVRGSVNGAAFEETADARSPSLAATSLDIGSSSASSGSLQFDSDILFMAFGKGTLTDANAAALNNIARNNRIDSRVEDLPGGCTFKWPSENWREGMAL